MIRYSVSLLKALSPNIETFGIFVCRVDSFNIEIIQSIFKVSLQL